LILRKIIEIVATRCHILRLKCTKFDFGWGSAPDPAGGAYSTPPDPQLDFRGPTSKGGRGREGEGRARGKGRARGRGRVEGKENGEKGRGREGRGKPPPQLSCHTPRLGFSRNMPDYGGRAGLTARRVGYWEMRTLCAVSVKAHAITKA